MGYASRNKRVCPECGKPVSTLAQITLRADKTYDEACKDCERQWVLDGFLYATRIAG